MFYSFIFFCIGGLLYLYKNNIVKFLKTKKLLSLSFVVVSILVFFTVPLNNNYLLTYSSILLSISLLSYCITYNSKLFNNKVTKLIGDISFEIYLCHMVIYRVLEKLNLSHLLNNNLLS